MQQSEWLAQVQEPIVDPDQPICDPHHHLWDHPGSRYLLDELLADLQSGHNVVATVFVECASMYRADGPEALRPVGETEYVAGRADESDTALALSGFAFFPAPVDGTSRRLVIQAESRSLLILPEARTLVVQKSTQLARQLPQRSPKTTTREPRRFVVLEE
jgi:hypothetical protein